MGDGLWSETGLKKFYSVINVVISKQSKSLCKTWGFYQILDKLSNLQEYGLKGKGAVPIDFQDSPDTSKSG